MSDLFLPIPRAPVGTRILELASGAAVLLVHWTADLHHSKFALHHVDLRAVSRAPTALVGALVPENAIVVDVHASRGGTVVAAAYFVREVRKHFLGILDVATNRGARFELASRPSSIHVGDTGDFIAIRSMNDVTFLDVVRAAPIWKWEQQLGYGQLLEIVPVGAFWMAFVPDAMCRSWSVQDVDPASRTSAELFRYEKTKVSSVAVSADSSTVALASGPGTVVVDTSRGLRPRKLKLFDLKARDAVMSVALNRRGDWLLAKNTMSPVWLAASTRHDEIIRLGTRPEAPDTARVRTSIAIVGRHAFILDHAGVESVELPLTPEG